jgi:acetyltransferase-like isoleucine patch superfamily enzyme
MQHLKKDNMSHRLSVYKFLMYLHEKCYTIFTTLFTRFIFLLNDVEHGSFRSVGLPLINASKNSKCFIGEHFAMVNNARYATLGKNNRCKLVIYSGASLIIGNSVAMSNTTIVATKSILLGNNILMGGGVTIVDSDFHSLNPVHWHSELDEVNMKSSGVVINNNVFIGMNTIILKGVEIGKNVIVAAGSVVTTSIPEYQVWGGNPARFIKSNN